MIYDLLFRLVLSRIDAERAHGLAARALPALTGAPVIGRLIGAALAPREPGLRVEAFGQTFTTPLGAAAGTDKDATWFESLGALGFGAVEVGTVTARAQPGNPRPRIFRLPKAKGILNSMGFPNAGAEATAKRLSRRHRNVVVGANVGRSKEADAEGAGVDYRTAVRWVAPHSDYLVINVSSPNTPGLRAMQSGETLRWLVGEVREELRSIRCEIPTLVKIAPDLGDAEIDAVADLALELELDGIVAVNTTTSREIVDLPGDLAGSPGGVSGRPLRPLALEVLERLYERVGNRLVLVSVGGIDSADDAWERLRAGATLVQAYSGFVFGGPLWPSRMNRGLAARLRASGASSLSEIIGSGVQAHGRAVEAPEAREAPEAPEVEAARRPAVPSG